MIKKIVLDIEGKEIKLTLEQAKELQEILNDTFGTKEIVYRDRWQPPYWHNPQPPYWVTTCENINGNWTGNYTSGTLTLAVK